MNAEFFSSGYKSRSVRKGTGVRVYRNLNNGKFSIKQWDRSRSEFHGKVQAHFSSVVIKCKAADVIQIMKSAQQRAKNQGVRNVHMFLFGELVLATDQPLERPNQQITYNPFVHDRFVLASSGIEWEPPLNDFHIILTEGRAYILDLELNG
ncbi:conserved hypothetical protein [Vibrio jasicida]|jgi:hypothetical protein|uniref:Uncharacterized protein n=1 Tax=Vibrio jasicida TaxID=766224 RepID=A0AAU9QXK0_9VIBR|nr:conserved hypothetical protein [Vibrio jasicida]CAH1601783.1 conserved hypothetical protein [Vibrio jasicida]